MIRLISDCMLPMTFVPEDEALRNMIKLGYRVKTLQRTCNMKYQ